MTFTLSEEMTKIINHYSERWRVTEQETMHRLFGVGAYMARGVEEGVAFQIKLEDGSAKDIEFVGVFD